MQRNHVSLLAQYAANGGTAILGKCANQFAGIHNLEGVERGSQGSYHIGCSHGQRNIAGLQNGMATRQQLLRINVGDRAGGRNLDIAANQLGADSRARYNSGQSCGRRFVAR